MAKIYAELIRKGLKTIDDVPDNLKEDVQGILGGDDGCFSSSYIKSYLERMRKKWQLFMQPLS